VTRRRALDWVLIVALVGSWAVLFARGIEDGLRNQRGQIRIGVSSAPEPDAYPTVIWSAWKPQLVAGDEVEAVEGHDLRGSSALRFYDLATRAAREQGHAIVTARRAGSDFDVSVGLTASSWWWAPYLFATALLFAALIVLVRAPAWHLARRFFVASWCIAVGYVVFESSAGPGAVRFEPTLAYALYAIGSVLTVWNAQDFALKARPVPVLQRSLTILPGALFLANYVVRYHLPYTVLVGDILIFAPNATLAVETLAGLTRSYARSDALERRQTRWILFGFYVGLIGNLAANLVSLGAVKLLLHLGESGSVVSRVVASVAGLAVPAGLLISVVGYRWLDIDPLISAAASYTIVGLSVLGIALALVPRVASAAAPALGMDPATVQWLLTMAFVVAAVPAHLQLRPQLDRRMFAERHARMSGFARLLDEIEHCSGAEELWKLSSDRIGELLEPRSVAVYVREGERFVPRFARGGEACSPYEADSVLVRALDRRGRPLAADSGELDPFDRAALETLGVALIVPVRAGERLIAFACLGSKRSGDIYTPEERSQLGAVAAHCGEVLLGTGESRQASAQIFRREGDLWTIASRGKQIHLRDMRGLHYLATLLREPGREFAALDLVSSASGSAPVESSRPEAEARVVRRLGDAGPVLDAQARSEYRARLVDLEAELTDAERRADLGRRERALEEREALLAELEASGRGARPGSDAERARIAVTKAIKTAFEKIAEAHPELGAHLAGAIRRGSTCVYAPDPRDPAEWEV
jgi:hypothetical protein